MRFQFGFETVQRKVQWKCIPGSRRSEVDSAWTYCLGFRPSYWQRPFECLRRSQMSVHRERVRVGIGIYTDAHTNSLLNTCLSLQTCHGARSSEIAWYACIQAYTIWTWRYLTSRASATVVAWCQRPMHDVGAAEQVWRRHGGRTVVCRAGTSDQQPEDRFSSRLECRLKPERAGVQRLSWGNVRWYVEKQNHFATACRSNATPSSNIVHQLDLDPVA